MSVQVYKICRVEGELIRSLYHPTFCYKLKEWVEAKHGGLLVFTELGDARYYHKADRPSEGAVIFSAEAKGHVSLPICRLEVEALGNEELVEILWKDTLASKSRLAAMMGKYPEAWDKDYDEELMVANDWPIGTLAYRTVRLLNVVE